jgi:predicted XRE-type DNA-binding protein
VTRLIRPISWIKAARKDFERFPEPVRSKFLDALSAAAEGGKADDAKPMIGLGSGVFEVVMENEKIELIHGSGNVYRDFGYEDADVRQCKAILGTQISKMLDKEGLSVRAAQKKTGFSASDFSRIRNANFSRFTLDRLISIVHKLDPGIEIYLGVRKASARPRLAPKKRRKVATVKD